MDEYLAHLLDRNYSPATVRSYGYDLLAFCRWLAGQGACSYANICEHCPSYRSEPSSFPILAAQRVDADALARDAEQRGWIDEAERHHKLIARLDALIADTETQTG